MNIKINFPSDLYQSISLSSGIKVISRGLNLNSTLIQSFINAGSVSKQVILDYISCSRGSFLLVLIVNNKIFCCVDRVSSLPLFYKNNHDHVYITNAISESSEDIDEIACMELLSSGFVLKNKTLLKDWKRLEAGTYMLIDGNDIEIESYFNYMPLNVKKTCKTLRCYIDALDAQLDNITKKMIEYVDGRRIVLLLSSGIDSRLLLAKLNQHKYKNIVAVTYGSKHIFEKGLAKYSAKLANVPWKFVNVDTKNSRSLFLSKERKSYALKTSSFSVIPCYMEYQPFIQLNDSGFFDSNDVIVNGQTGDFVSGGHIFKELVNGLTFEKFCEIFIKKHFGFWSPTNEKTYNYFVSQLKSYSDTANLVTLNDYVEWRERQSKLVIRGQRLYDYFNLDWHLPLWNSDYLDFWLSVPFKYKVRQNLLLDYVQMVFPKEFKILRSPPNQWQGRYNYVPYYANFLKLIFDKNVKENYYRRMSYYGKFYYQNALFGKENYLKYLPYIRNTGSLIAASYIEDLGIDIDEYHHKYYRLNDSISEKI